MESFHNYCSKNEETVCTVESCTAGLLANKFTTFSGASKWFKGGLVVYTDEIKSKLLDIDINEIKKNGAVSKFIVDKMCKKGLLKFEVDICIAISGFIEPSKKSGCFIGIAKKSKINDLTSAYKAASYAKIVSLQTYPVNNITIVIYYLRLDGATRYENQTKIVNHIITNGCNFCIL